MISPMPKNHDSEIARLKRGYRKFHREYYGNPDNQLFHDLVTNGQRPKTMVISCSDSRVDPSKIFGCKPGDLFMVRNVANLVPPHEKNPRHHATSAALEFAVKHLKVHHIVILGHSQCGGIRSLVQDKHDHTLDEEKSFITQWMKIAENARLEVCKHSKGLTMDQKACLCEEKALKISLQNLQTFSWIHQAVAENRLTLHAWHFNLECGQLKSYQPDTDEFELM